MGVSAHPSNAATFSAADPGPIKEPVTYQELNTFADGLICARRHHGEDLDLFLFQLVLELNRLSPPRDGSGQRLRGVNALSVADITGVPRETARRKLLALAGRGVVMKLPDNLYYASGPSEDLLACVRAMTQR